MDAGTDAGYEAARSLLAAGHRVAATSRHVGQLSRIMHGYSASRVLAIAADSSDDSQVARLMGCVERRFGQAVTSVIHGLAAAP